MAIISANDLDLQVPQAKRTLILVDTSLVTNHYDENSQEVTETTNGNGNGMDNSIDNYNQNSTDVPTWFPFRPVEANTTNQTTPFAPPTIDSLMNSNAPSARQDTGRTSMVVFISPYTAFILLAVVILIAIRIVQMCRVRKLERQQRALERELNSSRHEFSHAYLNNLHGIHLPIATHGSLSVSLELEDRVRLYQKTFRRNKHSRQLTAEDFSCHPEEREQMCLNHEKLNSNSGEQNKDTFDDSSDESEELDDIEMGGVRNCIDDNDDDNDNMNDDDDDEQTSFICLPIMSPLHNTDDSTVSSDSPKQNDVESPAMATAIPEPPLALPTLREKVSGTCIICFEDFQEGDTVVWSDHATMCTSSGNDNSSSSSPSAPCKHVFHEDCMVRYLASHSLRNKHAHSATNSHSYAENPCPTCRQPFCRVAQEDLLVAIMLKSVQVALQQSQQAAATAAASAQEETPDDHDNDDDGEGHGDADADGRSPGTSTGRDLAANE